MPKSIRIQCKNDFWVLSSPLSILFHSVAGWTGWLFCLRNEAYRLQKPFVTIANYFKILLNLAVEKGPVYLFLIMSAFSVAYAQSFDFIRQAEEFFEKKEYDQALSFYFRALHKAPSDATLNLKIGRTYLLTETKEQAVSFLEKAYKTDPEVDPDILYYLGMGYQCSYQYAKAKLIYERFKKAITKKRWPEVDKRIQECIFSHAMLSNPIDVIITNAGSEINSAQDDFSPTLTNDETVIYFTSTRVENSQDQRSKETREDIYTSKLGDDGDWLPAVPVTGLNSTKHEAVSSLSPDGKSLLLYNDVKMGDIFISIQKDDGTWQPATPLNSNINSPHRETSACFSHDGKKLYFASDRPGGNGGLDIYFSTLDNTGKWGKAINAGTIVNSSGNEDSPFIHADGVTMYFSSDGHPSMGSSDIFKTTITPSGAFTKPQNMGYPINSIDYDGFFIINASNTIAHFVSKRKHGDGGYDILRATYRSIFKAQPAVVPTPDPVFATKTETATPIVTNTQQEVKETKPPVVVSKTFTINGLVSDKSSQKPIGVALTLTRESNQQQIAATKSETSSGKYSIAIDKPGKYVLTAQGDGYLFQTTTIIVSESQANKVIEANFSMATISAGSIVVLRNVFFDSGKSDIKSSSLSELEKIRSLLLENPNLKLQINGHTDNVGDPAANKVLSLKRALAVVNYLALNGIELNRLSAKGYGSEKPFASNEDEISGRSLNRRTEIEILSNDKSF